MLCTINLFTGELIAASVDFHIRGWIPIDFERFYTAASDRLGPLGRGWSHAFESHLHRQGTNWVYRHSGKERVFAEAANYVSGSLSLTRREPGFVLVEPFGNRRFFVGSAPGADVLPLAAIEDAYGNRLRFRYDANRLVEITDDLGRRLAFGYDWGDRITDIALFHPDLPAGSLRLMHYEYDANGNLRRVADRAGILESYEYSGNLPVCLRDANGAPTYAEYDGDGRCVATYREGGICLRRIHFDLHRRNTLVVDSLGNATLYRFNDAGALVEMVDPAHNRTKRFYDDDNRLVLVQGDDDRPLFASTFDPATKTLVESNALGSTTTTVFGPANLPVRITNALGETTTFGHDEGGRLTLIRSPLGREWRYEYDKHGTLNRVLCPDGYWLTRKCSTDYLTVTIDGPGRTLERRKYDIFDNVVEYRGASGIVERFEYSARDDLIRHVVDGEITTAYTYDGEGNLLTETNPLGHKATFVCDRYGNLIRRVDSLGNSIIFRLNSEERLVEVVNERGERAKTERDALGRPIVDLFFDGRREVTSYSPRGNVVAVTDAEGGTTTTEYEPGGPPTKRVFPDGSRETYTYDPLGRLVGTQWSRLDGVEHDLEFAYDPDGRMCGQTQGAYSLRYEYNLGGLLSAVIDESGRAIRYEYSAERVLRRIDDTGRLYELAADASGELVTEIRFPGGLRQELSYDRLQRLVHRRVLSPSGIELAARNYEYDSCDQLIGMQDTRIGRYAYQYDPCGRLVQVTSSGTPVERYGYDTCGNQVNTPIHGQIQIGPGNRVIRAGGRSYDYDQIGRLVGLRDASGATTYRYNGAGQLAEVQLPAGDLWQYSYDPFWRRCEKRGPNVELNYTWDSNVLHSEMHKFDSHTDRTDYLFLPNTFVPLSQHGPDGTFHYSFDQLGTPTEAWDGAGSLVWSMVPHAFGAMRRESTSFRVPLHFQGQQLDAETGLYYTRFRYYDPTLGRFTTHDPLGLRTGLNLYIYPTNPLNWIDPLGLVGPTLDITCRAEWSDCEQYAAQMKVDGINKAKKKRQLKRTSPCRTNQRDYYERKCADPANPGSTHDIDHLVELQLGGMDQCCSNLWEMPRSPNRSIGSQIKNAMDDLGLEVGDCVGGVAISNCTKASSCSPKPKGPDPNSGCKEAEAA